MTLTLFAPAKLNLTLEVLGRRGDGYHEIRSIIQAVSLGDRLTFSPGVTISFVCDQPAWRADMSLVSRAAALMARECGGRDGALITISKGIPLASGLGGDSSDAASVLRGLATLWQKEIPPERLGELAAGLGSDVPFFLSGGTALAQGRGEMVTPLPAPAGQWLVIMTPDIPRPPSKTATLYARLGAANYTSGAFTASLAEDIACGVGVTEERLYNVFHGAAYDVFPDLARYHRDILAAGASRVHLAGAGPSLFSLHASREEAEAVISRLQGKPAFLAETLPA